MGTDLTSLIIKEYLYQYDLKDCRKFIINDGITTDYFLVEEVNGIINQLKFQVSRKKKEILAIGKSISILKNLDYYQYFICVNLPQIADNNPYKLEFQKLRILIIGAFSKLSKIITLSQDNLVEKWNKTSEILLGVVSNAVLSYRSNQSLKNVQEKKGQYLPLFEFLELDIKKIENALDCIYM